MGSVMEPPSAQSIVEKMEESDRLMAQVLKKSEPSRGSGEMHRPVALVASLPAQEVIKTDEQKELEHQRAEESLQETEKMIQKLKNWEGFQQAGGQREGK